jgi:hypothetical protein
MRGAWAGIGRRQLRVSSLRSPGNEMIKWTEGRRHINRDAK